MALTCRVGTDRGAIAPHLDRAAVSASATLRQVARGRFFTSRRFQGAFRPIAILEPGNAAPACHSARPYAIAMRSW